MTACTGRATAMTDALRRAAAHVEVVQPGRWHVRLDGTSASNAVATVAGEWLALSAPLPPDLAPRSPWMLVQFNTHLPGGVRVTLPCGGGDAHLRMDVPLDVFPDARGGEGRVSRACHALRRALTQVADRYLDHVVALPDAPLAVPPPDESGSGAWHTSLEEFSWPHRGLEDGRLRVELDARGGRYSAFASRDGHGVRLRVLLITAERLPTVCSKALGVALLAASDAVRLARPTVERLTDGVRIGLEAVLGSDVEPEVLVLAFGALQAACDQFGPEARALRDPVLASVYLDTTTTPVRAKFTAGHHHRDVRSTPGPSSHGELHVLHRIA